MRIAPAEFHLARVRRLRECLQSASLDALLVTSLPNLSYLTGLFASAGAVLVGRDAVRLIVDGRYTEAGQARAQALPGLEVEVVPPTGSFEESTADQFRQQAALRVGFEASVMTVRAHVDLQRRLATACPLTELVATYGLVEALRAVKDTWELGRLRDAAARLSDTAKCIMPKALAGMSELDVAGVIESELRRVGFERPAFDTIVAAGPNSARPHHRASDRKIEPGDLVVLDFGGVLDGYSVDLTRTVPIGLVDGRRRRLLEQVAEAQAAAFSAITVGRPATDVDRAARDLLAAEGLGEAFSHGTGHGLGLEIHERPRVGRLRADLPVEPLAEGMVFTLEPGAYLSGWGGARIEDDVVVTAQGGEWLTDVPHR